MRPEKTVAYYLPELRRVSGNPDVYDRPGGQIVPIHQGVLRDVADLLEEQQSKLDMSETAVAECHDEIKRLESRLDALTSAVERYGGDLLGIDGKIDWSMVVENHERERRAFQDATIELARKSLKSE